MRGIICQFMQSEVTVARPDEDVQSIASWPELTVPKYPAAPRPGLPLGLRPSDHGALFDDSHGVLHARHLPASLGRRRRRHRFYLVSWLTYAEAFGICTIMVGCAAVLVDAWLEHPLLPLRWRSADWLAAWLIAATANAFGCCLCFCAIVIPSERSRASATAWCLLCLIGGPPACSLYILLRLLRHGSLSLVEGAPTEAAGRGSPAAAELRALNYDA